MVGRIERTDADLRRRLYGTEQVVAPPRRLAAGPLSCLLEDGAIRRVSWHGIELIRGVAYLLRDANWGTAASVVRQLRIEEHAQRFRVRFEMGLALPGGELSANACIEGRADGHFSFDVQALASAALRTNRCGFVVLHPADVAGLPLTVEHSDGSLEEACFPAQISPGQPVFDIRSLRHEARPGLRVTCRLEAELPGDPQGKFEMEDQRNWSDASFKTYVGSLLDPWPYELPAGRGLGQRVQLDVDDARSLVNVGSAAPRTTRQTLGIGAAMATRMPAIGLGVPAGLHALDDQERLAIVALRPAWLVAEADLGTERVDEAPLARQLRAIAELASACGAQLQLDVLCPAELTPGAAARLLAQACLREGCVPAAVRPCPVPYLKSYQPQGQWPELPGLDVYARAFAEAFASCRTGGGMLTYFTELNRKRPPTEGLNFIGHTTCPIVHAADDLSVMETLDALPHIVRSVRALWPALPYRLGPVTLAMHRNPYGASPTPNLEGLRIAMAAQDPRHQGAFGAAWVAGYAVAVAPLGLELLSLHHSHGASGPLLRAGQPGWEPGACVPAWGVQQVLAQAQGAALLSLQGVPAGVSGLAWAGVDGRPKLLLANLGAEPRTLALAGDWTAHDLSLPWMPDGHVGATIQLDTKLTLEPYQVLFSSPEP